MTPEKLAERRRLCGMVPDTIGAQIIAWRTHRGMTLNQLSKKSNIPISVISALETGSRASKNMSLGTFVRLAQALDTTLDSLIHAPLPRQEDC